MDWQWRLTAVGRWGLASWLASWFAASIGFAAAQAGARETQVIEPSADRAIVELSRAPETVGVLRRVELEIGKSLYIQTDYTVVRVAVGDPEILDVVVLSPTELQLVPKAVRCDRDSVGDPAGVVGEVVAGACPRDAGDCVRACGG